MDDLTLPNESSVEVETVTPKATETPEAKAKRLRDEKLLFLARKQFKTALNATEHFRTQAQDDQRFRAGTWGKKSFQWPPGIQEAREADGRVCLTINRMPGFIRQVTNATRQAHLGIKVSPVDDKGDPKVAEVFEGLIKNTESVSLADRAYNMASDKQAEQGLGYFRIITEWASNDPDVVGAELFRQRVKLKRVKNPLSVYFDPSAQEADFHDGDYSFKVTDFDPVVFEDVTGHKPPTPATLEAFEGGGDQTGDWFPNGKVRYVEWFNRESKGPRVRKALLSTGHVINYPDALQTGELQALGITIVRDRWVQKKVMMWRKMDAVTIHEETEWPADGHQFIPVIGEELEIEGELDYRGVVRDAKETGRVYNVEVSTLTEIVGLGQKSPVVGYRGQFGVPNSPQRKAWETANQKPVAFLEIEPIDIDGKPAPIPQRVSFELPLEGTVLAIKQTDEDYKTQAGFRDASLGERGPQESGKAIIARQRQDELGSSHYTDNLRYAMCAAGRQLIQLYRVVYDTATVVRITGGDDKQRNVLIFSGAKNDPRNPEYLKIHPETQQPIPFALPEGVAEIYDIGAGEFDLVVSAGPEPGTRREQEVEAITSIFKALPPEISVKFLDLYFMLMDITVARQMAERAKKMLPPELQDDEQGKGPEVPPQVQAQMQQMQQKLTELMAAYQQAQMELQTDKVKSDAQIRMKEMDIASKEKLAFYETRADLLKTEATLHADKAIAGIRAEIEQLTTVLNLAHEDRMAHRSEAHDAAFGAAEAGHAADEAARERAHQLEIAATAHAQALEAADQDQQHALEQGDQSHTQALEAADQGQGHALEQIDAQPKPPAGGEGE